MIQLKLSDEADYAKGKSGDVYVIRYAELSEAPALVNVYVDAQFLTRNEEQRQEKVVEFGEDLDPDKSIWLKVVKQGEEDGRIVAFAKIQWKERDYNGARFQYCRKLRGFVSGKSTRSY